MSDNSWLAIVNRLGVVMWWIGRVGAWLACAVTLLGIATILITGLSTGEFDGEPFTWPFGLAMTVFAAIVGTIAAAVSYGTGTVLCYILTGRRQPMTPLRSS